MEDIDVEYDELIDTLERLVKRYGKEKVSKALRSINNNVDTQRPSLAVPGLDLSARTNNVLARNGVRTTERCVELVRQGFPGEMGTFRQCGPKVYLELKQALIKTGAYQDDTNA